MSISLSIPIMRPGVPKENIIAGNGYGYPVCFRRSSDNLFGFAVSSGKKAVVGPEHAGKNFGGLKL